MFRSAVKKARTFQARIRPCNSRGGATDGTKWAGSARKRQSCGKPRGGARRRPEILCHVYVKRTGYEVPQRVWTTTDAKPGSWAGVMTCSCASDWTVNSVVTMPSTSTA
jgi:hypothetical protein